MKSFCIGIFILTLFCPPLVLEAQHSFPESKTIEGLTLSKTNQTIFKWFFISVYEGALYVDSDTELNDILNPDFAKQLDFVYKVEISGEDFIKSGMNFLKKNCSEKEIKEIQNELDTINSAYENVEKGDRYTLTYIPKKGTTLALNGKTKATIKNPKFAQYYFRIWLGEEPVKDSFRDKLLTPNYANEFSKQEF